MSIEVVKHALLEQSRTLNVWSSNLDRMNGVSDRIRILRKRLGLTQQELGKAVGVTKAAVSQWEKGSSIPGRDALLALHNTFGIDTDWLLTGRGPMGVGEENGKPGSQSAHVDLSALTESQRKLYEVLLGNLNDLDDQMAEAISTLISSGKGRKQAK